MQPASPLVSIITATYNRSNVLKYSIASVINSTFSNWELLVIGDACTDDTEQIVASFNDPRISFINLNCNIGEQSGPNNEGFCHARGRYIAYLNHDDLWLPDHLETALSGIERTGADLVFTHGIAMGSNGFDNLNCATSGDFYTPSIFVPASVWLLKRELIEEIGPWCFYRECYATPSQDWLIRVWKAGKDLRRIPAMTVVLVQSGTRRNVYAKREFEENKQYFERICNERDFREKELLNAALHLAEESMSLHILHIWKLFRRATINIIKKIILKLGILPPEFINLLRYGKKGAYIDYLRKKRGLPTLKKEVKKDGL